MLLSDATHGKLRGYFQTLSYNQLRVVHAYTDFA